MFEAALTSALSGVLSAYFLNIHADQLSIGVWNGHLVLRNLQIRPALFESLRLFSLVKGVVGVLEITIPWLNIFSTGISIRVKDVHLCFKTDFRVHTSLSCCLFSSEDLLQESTLFAHNFSKDIELSAYELFQGQKISSSSDTPLTSSPSPSWTHSSLYAILSKLSVSLESIHLRVEGAVPSHITGRPGSQFSTFNVQL